MEAVPILESRRVRLREHRADDLDDYATLWSDQQVVRHIGGRPLARHECWSRILRFRGMWALLGYGFWIVEERGTGELIGEAGVMDLRREIKPSLDGTLEAGWAFLPAVHGRGIATETMGLVLDWAGRNHPKMPLSCIIAEENKPSLRLAAKLGFSRSEVGEYQDAVLVHFRRDIAN